MLPNINILIILILNPKVPSIVLDIFKDGESKFVWAHWDGTSQTETLIKDETKASIRCIPLPGNGPEPEPGKCIKTSSPSRQRVLFAKAY